MMKKILAFLDFTCLLAIILIVFKLFEFNLTATMLILIYGFIRIFINFINFMQIDMLNQDQLKRISVLLSLPVCQVMHNIILTKNLVDVFILIFLIIVSIKTYKLLVLDRSWLQIVLLAILFYYIFGFLNEYFIKSYIGLIQNKTLGYFIYYELHLIIVAFYIVFNFLILYKFNFLSIFRFLVITIIGYYFLQFRLNYCVEKTILIREDININNFLLLSITSVSILMLNLDSFFNTIKSKM